MLNTDFKILAKVLANRLGKVLLGMITSMQAYAVQGRDIADIVCSIKDTLLYMREEWGAEYLVSIDLEKAFNRVEHEYCICRIS